MGRHFLSVQPLSTDALLSIIERAAALAVGDSEPTPSLAGRVVGIYFRRASTRTRTSFSAGALRLGAQIVSFGPNDLQVTTGETLEDTGRVLAGYLDALVVRTNDSIAEMEALAAQGAMPVINAMSENEHPTQVIADLATLREAFGTLTGLHVLYLGEGNNTAAALALAMAKIPGTKLTVACPRGFGLPAEVTAAAFATAAAHGAELVLLDDAAQLPAGVDAVYTTRWETMGVSKPIPDWKPIFRPFAVDQALMARVSKPKGTVFLHDLPAVRGQEVTDEVLDGGQSLAFRQARFKMFGAMAVLEWCLA